MKPQTLDADSGSRSDPTAGSLRKAIVDANVKPDGDRIRFNIPGSGVHTIAPSKLLPFITDSVTIDG